MKSADLLQKTAVWHRHDQPASRGTERPPWLYSALGAAVVLLVVVSVLIASVARAGKENATASCEPATAYLPQLVALELKGQFDLAASAAQTALAHDGLCPEARRALTQHFVSASLEAIFTTPVDPRDVLMQTELFDRYATVKQLASESQVSFPSNAQIARRAGAVHHIDLARRAWEDAFRTGELTAADRESVRAYLDTLTTQGFWLAQSSGDTRQTGLQMLMAAYLLQNRLQVGSGEPYAALVQFLGTDQTSWPTTRYPSPLFDSSDHQDSQGGR